MFLKELESWLERGQNVPFLREICPWKKFTPNIGANIGAITGILLKYHILYKNQRNLIQWTSGWTGILQCYRGWIESLFARRTFVKTVIIIYLEYAKVPHIFFFKYLFTACFLLINLLVKIYRVLRKISYNWNPVNRSARKRIYVCKWTNMVYQLQMAMFWSILPRTNLIDRKCCILNAEKDLLKWT
jgi:hypothetical protein